MSNFGLKAVQVLSEAEVAVVRLQHLLLLPEIRPLQVTTSAMSTLSLLPRLESSYSDVAAMDTDRPGCPNDTVLWTSQVASPDATVARNPLLEDSQSPCAPGVISLDHLSCSLGRHATDVTGRDARGAPRGTAGRGEQRRWVS